MDFYNHEDCGVDLASEGYVLVGEKIWQLVGTLSSKDKTQLEERLRRVAGPSSPEKSEGLTTQASRLATSAVRSVSPAPSIASRLAGVPRSASPAVTPASRLARPISPAYAPRTASPTPSAIPQPGSPAMATSKLSKPSAQSHLPGLPSTSGIVRPKSLLPSRLAAPRSRATNLQSSHAPVVPEDAPLDDVFTQSANINGNGRPQNGDVDDETQPEPADDITVAISSILSNDPSRSVDALKRIQKVLDIGPEEGPSSPAYRELAEHTEGLIETITLQMAHVFERPDDLTLNENFRLAKHLIQTLNTFCDHIFLAESLTVDILTSLLEELTLRLLQTDNSPDSRVKDLSRFINMIILRLFNTARRMSVLRYVSQRDAINICQTEDVLPVPYFHCSCRLSNHSQPTVLHRIRRRPRSLSSF